MYKKKKILKLLNESKSFSDILKFNSDTLGNKIFLIDYTSEKKYEISYSKFNNYVDLCCNYFKTLNLKKGDIISLVMNNSASYLIFYFASIRYGTILNPLPTSLSDFYVKEKLNEVNPKIIFSSIDIKIGKYAKKLIKLNQTNLTDFIKFIKSKNKNNNFKKVRTSINDVVLLYYSSGTTGKSKIIEYTNGAMIDNQKGLVNSKFTMCGNKHLCFLPLFHTASLRYTIKWNICLGGTTILFKNFWSLKNTIWKIINKYNISYFQCVPSILNMINNTKYFKYKKPKSIKFIGCGSAILPWKLKENFERKFKIKISNLYGLSEIGCSHFENPFSKLRKPNSIGKILSNFKYKIFINKEISTKNKMIGELGVKGKNSFKKLF